jgi:hypothetical protein
MLKKGTLEMKTSLLKVTLAIAAMSALVSTADARTGVKIGSLSCKIQGGVGAIITSTKTMACTLHKLNGHKERYTGVIRKFGVDVGVTGKAKMVWLVFAPGRVNRGALRGTYVGAAANASAIIGGGANVLLGGFNRSISLQPVSLQVQTGINIAAGVGTLELN